MDDKQLEAFGKCGGQLKNSKSMLRLHKAFIFYAIGVVAAAAVIVNNVNSKNLISKIEIYISLFLALINESNWIKINQK